MLCDTSYDRAHHPALQQLRREDAASQADLDKLFGSRQSDWHAHRGNSLEDFEVGQPFSLLDNLHERAAGQGYSKAAWQQGQATCQYPRQPLEHGIPSSMQSFDTQPWYSTRYDDFNDDLR